MENPVSGQRLIFRKTARDTAGDLLEVESVYTKPTPPPSARPLPPPSGRTLRGHLRQARRAPKQGGTNARRGRGTDRPVRHPPRDVGRRGGDARPLANEPSAGHGGVLRDALGSGQRRQDERERRTRSSAGGADCPGVRG